MHASTRQPVTARLASHLRSVIFLGENEVDIVKIKVDDGWRVGIDSRARAQVDRQFGVNIFESHRPIDKFMQLDFMRLCERTLRTARRIA